MRKSALGLALMVFTLPTSAFGWGTEGHQIIAYLAATELTPAAKAQIEQLLGDDAEFAMVELSTWADEIRREQRDTAPWHFVDIPIDSAGYNAQRDCPQDDCVVAQIAHHARIVGDKSLLVPVRAEALRFLIHFVGEHAPTTTRGRQRRPWGKRCP